MFSGQARWLLLVGLSGGALVACSEEAAPGDSGTAGTSPGGSGGAAVAGSPSGGSTTAGSDSGGSAGSTSAGSGGSTSAGTGGSAGDGGAAAGGSGGSGGGDGGSGGGAALPTAVANITGANGMNVTGTATFTQEATMTTVVINLTACTNGPLVSHLHENKDCGNNANAAGNHWSPNGEMLGNYTCDSGTAMHTASKPTSVWTVGGSDDTDVTQFSFMVHAGSDPAPGQRIGCGVIDAQ